MLSRPMLVNDKICMNLEHINYISISSIILSNNYSFKLDMNGLNKYKIHIRLIQGTFFNYKNTLKNEKKITYANLIEL